MLVSVNDAVFRLHPLLMNGDCGFAAIAKGINLQLSALLDLCPTELRDSSIQNNFLHTLRSGISSRLVPQNAQCPFDSPEDSPVPSLISSSRSLTNISTSNCNQLASILAHNLSRGNVDADKNHSHPPGRVAFTFTKSSQSISAGTRAEDLNKESEASRPRLGSFLTKSSVSSRSRRSPPKRKSRSQLTAKDIRRAMADEVRDNMCHYVQLYSGLVTAQQLESLGKNVERPGLGGFWFGSEAGLLEFVILSRALSVNIALYCFDVPSQSIRRFEHVHVPDAICDVCLLFTGPATSGHFDLLVPISPSEKRDSSEK